MEKSNGNNTNTENNWAQDLVMPFLLENVNSDNLKIITHHILARNIDKVREYLIKEGDNPTINYYSYESLGVDRDGNGNVGALLGPNMEYTVGIELLEKVEIDWGRFENKEEIANDIMAGAVKGITNGLLKKLKGITQGIEFPLQEYMKLTTEGALYYAALSQLSGELAIITMDNAAMLLSRDLILHDLEKRDLEEINDITQDRLFTFNVAASGTVTDKNTGEQKEFSLHININHSPLNINFNTGEAHYPVNFYIYNTGLPYPQWLEEDKIAVWEILKKDLTERKNALNIVGDDRFSNFVLKNKDNITERRTTAEPLFPVVKIDIQTENIGRVLFQHKGIFTNYNKLKTREEILEEYKNKNGLQELTPGDIRKALMEAGEYKSSKFVVRDFGSYAIGFNNVMYIDYLLEAQEKLKENLEQPNIFDQAQETEKALMQIRAYILAHKIFQIVLSEVWQQKKTQDLIISKEKMLNYLGYRPEEKQIYNNIKEALICLRYLDYVFFDYTKHNIKKTGKTKQGDMIGNFVYNLRITDKEYILGVNPYFVGCVSTMFEYKQLGGKEEKKKIFDRGYYKYPTALIPMSKDYSEHGYFLTQFLSMERGNNKLNIPGSYKVIAYKCKRYMKEAKINNGRPDRRKNIFIRTLKEIHIIEDTEPKIEELEKMRPLAVQETTLRIFIKDPVEKLNEFIHTILSDKAKSN